MCVTRGRGVVEVMVGGWRLREEGQDGKLKGIVEEGTGKFVCVWGGSSYWGRGVTDMK